MINFIAIFLAGFLFGYYVLPLFTPKNIRMLATEEYIEKRINELFDTVPEECLPLNLNYDWK